MITTLSFLLFLIFSILAGFHFYWVSGGTWGSKSVFPTRSGQVSNFAIPKFATLLVALVLTSFALLYLRKADLITLSLPTWAEYAYWAIPAIFIVRAIGEFNYVGFFKKVKDTAFAKADTKLFSPLCLLIGLLGLLVQVL